MSITKFELASLIGSGLAICISTFAIKYDYRSFLFDIVNKRAEKVNDVWTRMPKARGFDTITNGDYQLWSKLVSEIIITINIIQIVNKDIVTRFTINKKKYLLIFWEMLDTSIRMAIINYKVETYNTDNKDLSTFQNQMKKLKIIFKGA